MFNRIVVGVDDSAPAQTALRWAIREAARRHCALMVISTFPDGTVPDGTAPDRTAPERTAPDEAPSVRWLRRSRTQREQIRAACAEVAPGVPVRIGRQLRTQEPAEALAEAATTADLLVVGTQRPDLALASVSGQLSRIIRSRRLGRACPLVVIPSAGGEPQVITAEPDEPGGNPPRPAARTGT